MAVMRQKTCSTVHVDRMNMTWTWRGKQSRV